MKTVTFTEGEYKLAKALWNNDKEFKAYLMDRVEKFKPVRNDNRFSHTYTKAKLMLEKLQWEQYNLQSIETEGTGTDKYLTYLEYKDGTPLTESELDGILDHYELHQELLSAKFN